LITRFSEVFDAFSELVLFFAFLSKKKKPEKAAVIMMTATATLSPGFFLAVFSLIFSCARSSVSSSVLSVSDSI